MGAEKPTQKQTVLLERGERLEESHRAIGPQLCGKLYRVLKSSRTFSLNHVQTQEACGDMAEWVNTELTNNKLEQFSLQFTEHNIFLNGQLVAIDERARDRGEALRKVFITRQVNQVIFRQGLDVGQVIGLLEALADNDKPSLNGFQLACISLEQSIQEEEGEEVDDDGDVRREILELYAGLMVRCRTYFERSAAGVNASTRDLKRLIQRVADHIADYNHAFVGLIHLRLLPGKDFVHAANVAIYSMVLGHAVGLTLDELVRCGMTAIAQDVDKLGGAQVAAQMEIGDKSHFETNLTSVVTLSQKGTRDVLSALRLVTNYERGFPYNRPLPPEWYEDKFAPHLLTRIIEVARDYDVLTQGFGGLKPMLPDLALQALMEKMGSHYDPILIKLFINALGLYPAGSTVRLNDGRTALVIQSSAITADKGLSRAARPVLRLLDGTEQIIDLKAPSYANLAIERVLEHEDVATRPGAFLLF
jgi:hypothetical protein